MGTERDLPPGQEARADFPRFGLPWQVGRVPALPLHPELALGGDVANPLRLAQGELATLERVTQVADFHCVTTWSHRGLRWGGWRFRDFYSQIFLPRTQPVSDARLVVFRGLDGFVARLPLDDALDESVLIASELDGDPLPMAHGAPLRLVAPKHYGYKNLKHLAAIECWRDGRMFRPIGLPGQDHPRARVAFEERGRWPAWLLRLVYRPCIAPIVRHAARALASRSGA